MKPQAGMDSLELPRTEKRPALDFVPPGDENEWGRLLRRHSAGRCVVPSWEEAAGWRNVRLGICERGNLVGGAVVSLRKIPKLPFSLARITCLMSPYDHHGRPQYGDPLERFLGQVERYCRRRGAIEIELRLRIPESGEVAALHEHAALRSTFERLGYRPLSKPDLTYVVRIDRDDEALLGSFEGRTRNAIRKAERDGASVSRSSDVRLLEQLHAAMLEMSARKKGAPVPVRALVVDAVAPLVARGTAMIFVERHRDQIAHIAVIDALGVPCYMLGARTEANVQGEAGGSAQLLQYEMMRYLRDRGARYYDLGGCEGPTPDQNHENYGVWRFKYRFRGELVRFVPYYRKFFGTVSGWCLELAHRLRGDPV